jgi:hypothetical protein
MGAPDDILNAYRMAHFYGQNPEVFLRMPIADLRSHVANTFRLREAQRRERKRAEED